MEVVDRDRKQSFEQDAGGLGEDAFEDLPVIDMRPRAVVKHFGPGLVLMMTGIGTSHLVTSPVAGAKFQWQLLWCYLFSYSIKYYGFEMAFRITNATGKGALDAYATFWKKWPLWYTFVSILSFCVVNVAGITLACAATINGFAIAFGWAELDLRIVSIVLMGLGSLLVLFGNYELVQAVNKWMALVLVGAVLIAFFLKVPPLAAYPNLVIPSLPAGSGPVISALLGFLPSGLDGALAGSEWTIAANKGLCGVRKRLEQEGLVRAFDPFKPRVEDLAVDLERLPRRVRDYAQSFYTIGHYDFALGYVISMLLGMLIYMVAAVHLYPADLKGTAAMERISRIFDNTFGEGWGVLFLLGGFAAIFSTVINILDSFPRIMAGCLRNLFECTAKFSGLNRSELTQEHRSLWYSEYNLWRLLILFSFFSASTMIVATGGRTPVQLVFLASSLTLAVSPIIALCNFWACITIIPRTSVFHPSPMAKVVASVTTGLFCLVSAVLTFASFAS